MNPFGSNPYANLYQSQADMYQNSFSNPMNPANMNPGFGMDPNLMTPDYTASYRPQYSGAQPYGGYGRQGFASSANQLFNPFYRDPSYGNPVDNQRQAIESFSSRPFDSVIWAGQRIAAPALAFGYGFKYAGPVGSFVGGAMGRGLGRGLASGIGLGAEGFAGTSAGWALGAAGSFAGSVIGGIAAGKAVMWGLQKTIFNPYINTRREARDLRDNFAGVTFNDASGNPVTGQGLSYQESTNIAHQMTRDGIRDYTFSAGQYANIGDYSARAGLLDDVKSKQISQRVKDISEQIKLVMTIANDPSIKNAIEQIAALHNAGASTKGLNSQTTQALMSIAGSAAVAGRSVQNVMNTVGAQGQYLYQANGLTPYLGQMAAANILGSFETAKRDGLFTTAQLARMGGTEGATQGALTAQVNGSQTLLNKIGMYNQYISGARGTSIPGRNASIPDQIATFGAAVANDPLGVQGALHLYSGAMASRQLADSGPLGLENQVVTILNASGAQRNKNGQYSAEQMAGVMSGAMGMSDDQIQDYVAERSSETNPDTYRQNLKARDAQTKKQLRQYVSQHYLYGGKFGRGVKNAFDAGRNITTLTGDAIGWATDGGAWVGDEVQKGVDSLQFGSTFNSDYTVKDLDKLIDTVSPARTTKTKSSIGPKQVDATLINEGHDLFSVKTLSDIKDIGTYVVNGDTLKGSDTKALISRINAMARQGDQHAIAFTSAKDPGSRSRALATLLKTRKDDLADLAPLISGGGSNAHRGNYDKFINDVGSYGTHTEKVNTEQGRISGVMGDISTALGENGLKQGGKLDFLDSMNAIGQISDLAGKIGDGANQQEIEDMVNSGNYGDLKKLLGGRKGQDIQAYIETSYKRIAEKGLGQLGHIAYNEGFNINMDSSKIQDPNERAKFEAAKRAGDTATMKNIVSKQLAMSNGGKIQTDGLLNASKQSLNDVIGFQKNLDSQGEGNVQAYSRINSGSIDYATTQIIQNNLDTRKNNDAFKAAVDKWDAVADKMSKTADQQPGGILNPINWFQGKPAPAATQTSNQRDGGAPR